MPIPPIFETAPSADLIAEPQLLLPEAYDVLADPTHPYKLGLPFDLWLKTVRAYLARVGITHADLLHALRPVATPPSAAGRC